jgi:hypothetical protein
MITTDSQKAQIKHLLEAGRTITSLEALRLFGSLRLSGRIFELREEGLNIESRWKLTMTGKRVAEYFIKK